MSEWGTLWSLPKQTNRLTLKVTLERLRGRIPAVSAPRWSVWKLLSILNGPSLLCLTESASIQSIISVCKWNLLKKEHKATESCITPFISVQWPAAMLWFTELKLMICLKKKKLTFLPLVEPLNSCYTCQHIMTGSCQVLMTRILFFRLFTLCLRTIGWK